MKIVAFSDPHRDLDAARALVIASVYADVATGAGDFGDRGVGASEVLEVLAAVHCPLLIVSGNHDRLTELACLADRWPHVHLLHGSTITIDGVVFVGLGGAVARSEPSSNSEWVHEADAATLLEAHERCDILISHTPPVGAADIHPDGTSGGSTAVRTAVLRMHPELCLCGHVHCSHGVRAHVGATLVHNLGPDIASFRLGNGPMGVSLSAFAD